MHKKKNQLFRIIRTMKPTEKAYFKKYGFKQEKQNKAVLSLFELSDRKLKKSDEIFEEDLSAAFQKKNPRQQYVKVKSRLLEMLLEALREYDKQHNEEEKLFDLLAYSESLRKRNLFHDALSILQKAERLAEELEMIELLILIQNKKYYYEIFTRNYAEQYTDHPTIHHIHQNLDILGNRLESDLVTYRILHFQKSIGMPRKEEEMGMLKELQKHPAFGGDYLPRLASSQINLALALNGIYFSIGDTRAVLKVSEKLINHYQPGDKLRRLNSGKYLGLFDSFLQAALLSFEIPLFEKYYPIFLEIPTYGADDRNLKWALDLYARSIYAIVTRQLDHIPELVEEFDTIKDKSFIPNYRKISLAYYMVFGPFLRKDYSTSYHHIQWMKNNRAYGLRYDIEVGILGMECVILLEQGDLDLLEYRIRSYDEFLKREGRKFAMEGLMITWLRKSLQQNGEDEFKALCQEVFAKMEAVIQKNPAEQVFLQAFDVKSWLESHILENSFESLYYKNNIPGNWD